jgi:tetratricopeptide (TPR) repeat protein
MRLGGSLVLVAMLAWVGAGPTGVIAEDPPPAPAGVPAVNERAQRLDALFRRLVSSNDAAEGETLVEEIWRVWLLSGRPEIDAMMRDALALMDAANPAAALTLLDAIVARAPDWAEGWNKRATVLYLINEYERSLLDIERVLALEPRHFGALAGRALIHIARENYRAALADYRRAHAVNPFLQGAGDMIPALERRIGEKPL